MKQTITAGTTTVTGSGPGIPWRGWFFYPPSKGARSSQTAFVACDSKISTVNIGDHSVVNVDLMLNEFQSPMTMTVSADGAKVYVSTNGQTATWYPAKLLVVDATSGTVAQRFDLKDSPVPSGFTSLAIAGDGMTLYGSGLNVKQNGTVLVAMDATTGAILRAIPYQPRDPAHPNARMVMSVVLGDGTIPNLPPPKGGAAVFGSDGKGLAALPDGQRLCRGGKTLWVDRQDPGAANEVCSAIVGASSVIAPGAPRGYVAANIFGRFATADEMLSGTKAMTPDGKTLFLTGPQMAACDLAPTSW